MSEPIKTIEQGIQEDCLNGFIKSNLEPIKCKKCGGTNFEKKITDTMDNIIMEYNVICTSCHNICGCWAHGFFLP